MASSRLLSVLLLTFVGLPTIRGITTTHHDKPEDTKLPVMASNMKKSEVISKPILNTTLGAAERQKRLLPYMTFYLAQDFNQPQSHVHYNQNGQRYTLGNKNPTTFEQFHQKYNELTGTEYRPKYESQTNYQEEHKLTPFSENNALPGPFVPMRTPNSPAPSKVIFTPVRQYQTAKLPNYSVIYDKLSQLKLQQQNTQLGQNYNRYKQQYVPQNYERIPQQVNYIPVREFNQEVYHPPAKTIIQTYTASSVDIPKNTNYEQIQVPVKAYNKQQIKTYVPEAYQEIQAPHQDHVQPLTEEDQKQYIEDQRYHTEVRKQVLNPVLIVRQSPRIVPHKNYQAEHKPQKPFFILQRNPLQKPYNNFEVFPTKYESVKFNPIKYNDQVGPKYEFVTENPPAKYSTVEVETIPVTPKYIDIVPKYEQKPARLNYDNTNLQKFEKPKELYIENYISNIPKYAPKYDPLKFKPPQKYNTATEYPLQISDGSLEEHPNSLNLILKKLQDTNALPHTLTPDNIDNSIRTLVRILSNLKKNNKQKITPIIVPDESVEYDEDINNEAGVGLGGSHAPESDNSSEMYPENTPEGGTPGKAGVDYPALSTIPKTSFSCKTQRYKGFFGDPDTHCQVWHYCDLNGGQASFLCPNGTIFSQVALTCDWWYNVKCSNTAQLYVLNERLYKYILPLSPKFPEDYSGPLVDRYIALKFKEMEEKMKKERENKEYADGDAESEEKDDDDADELDKKNKAEGHSNETREQGTER